MPPQTPSAAIPPPAGEVSNFDAGSELWRWNIVCQTLCLGITGIMWVMRLYVRIWVKRSWILEDYLAVLSYLSLLTYGAMLSTAINHRAGTHEWDLHKPEAQTVLYWLNIVQITYGPAAAFIKSAILVLYLRVFSPQRWTPFDTSIRVFILLVVLLPTSISIAKILQCLPRERIWNSSVPGTCVNLAALLDSSGVFNIVSDLVILLVPVKGLWGLKMDRKRKIGIYAVFTVGIVGPIFSIVGLVMRLQLATSNDSTYNQPIISLWAMAELATGMMVICLPTLPGVFVRRKIQPTRSIIHSSSQYARYGNSRHYAEIEEFRGLHRDKKESTVEENELSDVSVHYALGSSHTPSVINRIQGGYSPPDTLDRGYNDPASGKILKTVTVEVEQKRP